MAAILRLPRKRQNFSACIRRRDVVLFAAFWDRVKPIRKTMVRQVVRMKPRQNRDGNCHGAFAEGALDVLFFRRSSCMWRKHWRRGAIGVSRKAKPLRKVGGKRFGHLEVIG